MGRNSGAAEGPVTVEKERKIKDVFRVRLIRGFLFWGVVAGALMWFTGTLIESVFFTYRPYLEQLLYPATYTLVVHISSSLICVGVGVALELAHKRYRKSQNRRAEELSTLFETSAAVSSTLDESDLRQLIVDRAGELLRADGCIFYGYDEVQKVLVPMATSVNLYREEIMRFNVPMGEGITGRAALERRTILANKVHLNPEAKHIPGTPNNPTSILAAPLVSGSEFLGAMSVLRLSERDFNEHDLGLFTLFVSQASEAAGHSRLFSRLRESEKRFRSFEGVVTDMIYRYDTGRKDYDFISPSFETMTGYTIAEIRKNPPHFWENLVYPEDAQRVKDEIKTQLSTRGGDDSYNLEYRIVAKSGEVLCVNERGNFELDRDGNIASFNGVVRDITERKHTELLREVKARLLEKLRQAGSIEDCLNRGCQAVSEARLFKRAIFTTKDENGMTTHIGQTGIDRALLEEMNKKPPAPKELLARVLREEFKISHSYFVTAESGANLEIAKTGRYLLQEESSGAGPNAWQRGDELLVPMFGMDGSMESFLTVDTPYSGARPDKATVLYLEDIADIVARQIHEIENLEALRTSEELSRTVIERSPLGVSIRNKNGKLLSANEAWKKIWAMPEVEYRADLKRERQELHFEKRDSYLKTWQPQVREIYEKGGYLHIPEVQVLNPRPGGALWVSHHFYAIRGSSGEVSNVVILTEDISDHKKAEEALMDSEERYRSLTESALVGIYIFSPDNRFLYANPATEKIFGYTREELMAMENPWGVVLEEDIENVINERERMRLRGEFVPPTYDLRIRRKSGEVAVLEIKSHPIIFEGKTAYLGNCIDITERKRVQDALSREHSAFRIIAEASIRAENIPDLCQRVLSGLVDALGFDAGTFRLYDEGESVLELVASVGLREEEKANLVYLQTIDDPRYVAAFTARTRKPLIVPDVAKEEMLDPYLERLNKFSERSLISWPMLGARENLLGIWHLWSRERVEISGTDQSFFERVSGMFGAALERKHAEEALRESEERYRAFTEEAMVGVYIYREGSFLFVNREMERISGYSREELLANPPDIMVLPEEEESLKARERDQKEGREVPRQYNMRIYRKTGEISMLEVRTRPIIYGGEMAFLGNCVDVTEVRKMQEALSESEERYRVLTEEAMMGIYVASGSRFVFANPAMEKITGYSREELLGLSLEDIIHPEELDVAKERESQLKPGEPDQYNMRIKKKDGGLAVLEVRTRPLSSTGEGSVFLGNCVDVTELVNQRAQIEHAKLEWERTFDSIPDMVMILDIQQNIIRANRAVAEYMAVGFPELLGKKYLEVFHLKGRESAAIRRIQSKIPEHFEIADPVTKRTFSVSVAPLLDPSGEVLARVYVARDITDMRSIEEALVQSEAQFRGLAESAQDVIFSLDHEGKVLYINPALKEIFDYDPASIVGVTVRDLIETRNVPASTRSVIYENLFERTLKGKTAVFEIEIEDASKRIHVLEVSVRKLPNQILGIARDITNRKRMEEQLIRASKLASIGVLAAGIAHQVNNPLAIMLATSTVLRDIISSNSQIPPQVSEEASKYLDTMEIQVERTRRVVSGLLEFTQPKRSEVEPSDVNVIVSEALELLADPLDSSNLDLDVTFDDDLPLVLVDPVALQQSLINIIQNAYEAMNGKGKLEVKIERSGSDTIRITLSDNGPGIPPYLKEEIFEPLFTTKTDRKGTGLGLPVSVMLLERFGGSIRLEDTPGGGATFVIEVPIREKEQDAS